MLSAMGNTTDLAHHPTAAQLEAGLEHVRRSPANSGALLMIVRRPDTEEREVVDEGVLDVGLGLVGDNWKTRGNPLAPDGKASPEAQITVINARLLHLVAQAEERWPLAGDQLVVDLDLSMENLPPGTRLCIGSAVLEVSAKPHTGCHKFEARFGRDALKFISSPVGRDLRLRGLNARVVESGTIRVGDAATVVSL